MDKIIAELERTANVHAGCDDEYATLYRLAAHWARIVGYLDPTSRELLAALRKAVQHD